MLSLFRKKIDVQYLVNSYDKELEDLADEEALLVAKLQMVRKFQSDVRNERESMIDRWIHAVPSVAAYKR